MARMPDGQPYSVEDPLGAAWDDMIRRNRLLQLQNDPSSTLSAPVEYAAAGPTGGSGRGQAPIDPSNIDVFPRGADGQLHPLPGWHTTGPFDFGKWAHNVDWQGVGRDLRHIATGVTGWFLPPVLGPLEKAAIAANLEQAGEATLDDLQRERSGR